MNEDRDPGRELRQVQVAQELIEEYGQWLAPGWQIVPRVGRTATFDASVAHADLERDPANRIAMLTLHPDLPEEMWRSCTLHELLHITTAEVEHDLTLFAEGTLAKKDLRRLQRVWGYADERLIETLVRTILRQHHASPLTCYVGMRPLDHDEDYTYAQSSSRRGSTVGFSHPD